MKKRVLSFALVLVMCLALLPSAALAAPEEVREDLFQKEGYKYTATYIIDDGVLIKYVLGYNLAEMDGLLPDEVEITLPSGITRIEELRCNGATSIIIPDSVTEIGTQAFNQCRELISIELPDSVTKIEDRAFSGCSNITHIEIPDSVTEFGDMMFYDLNELETVILGNGITDLGESAFRNCSNLISVNLPKGITEIKNSAFDRCLNLTSIDIPDGVTKIGDDAFIFCGSLTSINIPDGVTKIGDRAFQGTDFESITIPASVTEIGYNAFSNNCVIKGVSGSFAETYVNEPSKYGYSYALTFVPTDDTTDPTPALDLTSASTWAQEGITNAVAANLVPQALQSAYTQAATRAEFAALAVALYEQVTGTEIAERKTFSDTTDINVEKAAAIGIVAGVGDNKFSPDSGLTREQAAVMLARLADVIGKPLAEQGATFADNASISTWAIEQVGQIQAGGIMSGVGDNTFAPQSAYTREQSIVTVLRLYDIVK